MSALPRISVLIALAAALVACGGQQKRPPNVLVVVIDTLRADRLGAYGNGQGLTPFLDSVAARGTVFEHAYAASCWTVPSVAGLFTSRFPSQNRMVTFGSRLADDEVTVAERLRDAGWVAGGFVTNHNLQRRFGWDQGFAEWQAPPEHKDDAAMEGDTVRAQTLAWLDRTWQRDSRTPILLYVHYMEPHEPYEPREPFRSRFAANVPDLQKRAEELVAVFDATPSATESEKAAALARFEEDRLRTLPRLYDAEVAAVDEQMRLLFAELERRGFLDDAVIVVTSDHGEEFWEHGNLGHGHALYEESVRVPLILAGPGVPAGRRVTANVSTVDVAPTLLALLRLPSEPRFEGRSLPSLADGAAASARARPGPDATTDPLLQFEPMFPGYARVHVRGIVRERRKLLVGEDGRTTIFDLEADPGERHGAPVDGDHPSPMVDVLGTVDADLATRAAPAAQVDAISDGLKERLRALGYAR